MSLRRCFGAGIVLGLVLSFPALAQPIPGPLERGQMLPPPALVSPSGALPPPTPVPGPVMVEEAPAPPPPILLAPPPTPMDIQMKRAGYPLSIRCFAKPSDNGQYVGYYVGGGCPYGKFAQPRTPEEGTWGWDYSGCWFHRCVMLGWWHGNPQGGRGAYRTDGPNLIHHFQETHQSEEGH